jgi:hypothetical protein
MNLAAHQALICLCKAHKQRLGIKQTLVRYHAAQGSLQSLSPDSATNTIINRAWLYEQAVQRYMHIMRGGVA